ncbi:hypothetical protein BPNPMPFG_002483 [Mesorhizobium sp. AR07]|uniref:hypothetical protein n=1 Tax=Mesorhizobium sp. AR07 TaxID=2865838 RepID=UPI00216041D6|nr:hypothetical protein [Mesorhizobium sp. AR07]UVK46775.1 hypothetical protein BPNPMPFG_002483 [Mesorhizobium sp. AR07]
MSLRWENDPDPISPIDLIAFAGEVPVGGVRQSGSGRFRWEIVQLPGNPYRRGDHAGWVQTQAHAKAMVQLHWDDWLRRATSENQKGGTPASAKSIPEVEPIDPSNGQPLPHVERNPL